MEIKENYLDKDSTTRMSSCTVEEIYEIDKVRQSMNQTIAIAIPEARNILEQYTMTDTLKRETLPTITRNMVRKMNKNDKKIYKKLLQKLTIYRGCHKDEANSPRCQSWTLSKNVARHFAWVHYAAEDEFTYDDMKDRVVLKATILKKDVYAYLGFLRGEEECIVNLGGLKDIEIIEEYDYFAVENLYNQHLTGAVLRHYQTGRRGIIRIKDFNEKIIYVDICEFLLSNGIKIIKSMSPVSHRGVSIENMY